ncbi:hypothetical protein Plhal304r1_c010g0038051 [Plasmopara halstedii]
MVSKITYGTSWPPSARSQVPSAVLRRFEATVQFKAVDESASAWKCLSLPN